MLHERQIQKHIQVTGFSRDVKIQVECNVLFYTCYTCYNLISNRPYAVLMTSRTTILLHETSYLN
jgi:hypothetical protein